jgi:uncharacterized membrane protein
MKQGIRHWHLSDTLLFAAFCAWMAIGLASTALGVNEDTAAQWGLPRFLQGFVSLCLQAGDPVLIVLAALNTHWLLCRVWGVAAARRWLLIVVVSSAAVETLGTLTGFPFGPYSYTANFGPQLGPLPVTIPLAWHVLLGNALILWRSMLPGFVPSIEALAAAAAVTAIDWVMEPFASKVKYYWVWSTPGGAVPPQNYLAWGIVAFLLIRFAAKSPAHQQGFEPRPFVILGSMLLLFALGRSLYGF